MDSGSVVEGQRLTSPFQQAVINAAAFDEFERRFLDLLASDMSRARDWFDVLEKTRARMTPEVQARRSRLIGRYYHATSDFGRTIRWTRKAYRQFETLGHQKGTFQCLRTLFSAYMYSSRYDRARECAASILESSVCPTEERLKILVNLGNLEHRLNRYHAAQHRFAEALSLLAVDKGMEAIVRYNMANVQVCLNQFGDAETNYHQALSLFEHRGATLYQAYVQQALAYLYVILGQYFQGERRLSKARTLYLAKEDHVGAALCDLDRFHLRTRLNQTKSVLQDAQRLTTSFEKLGLAYETGLILFYAMQAALVEDELSLAESFLERASDIFQRERNGRFLALCRLYDGLLCARQAEIPQALASIDQAREMFVEEKLGEQELVCLVHRFRLTGELSQVHYRRARRLLAEPMSHEMRTRGLLMISDYRFNKGQIKRAIDSRFEAVMTIEESRASIVSKELRARFFGDKIEAYERLIEWLFQWKDVRAPDLIFQVLEMSRGRQLAEQLSSLEALPPVLNRHQATLLEKNRIETRLGQLSRKINSFNKEYQVAKAEKKATLREYRDCFQSLQKLKLRMRDQARLGIYFPVDLTPSEIQRYLPAKCLVLSYFLRDNKLYRVGLDREGLQTQAFDLYSGFRRDLNLLFRLLANRLPNREAQIDAILARVSPLLLPPQLDQVNHIVFIPHGNLAGFPFALLAHKGRYLLETHRMTMCHSLPVLYFSLKRVATSLRKPLFFFSEQSDDPAATERDVLKELFPKSDLQHTFVPHYLKQVIGRSDFIHFAGHCGFNSHQPSRSHLRLAGRRIYLRNLRNVQLNGPFINLASCSSGSVVLQVGNEPYGFVTSLFAAGATNILASLWDLDDAATSQWMKAFYQHIDLGLSEAFRQACLGMIAAGKPVSDWAGFWLLGKPQ